MKTTGLFMLSTLCVILAYVADSWRLLALATLLWVVTFVSTVWEAWRG